jgi:hypothetical protein
LQYTIKNISPNPVYDFYVGLFFDWDIPLSSPDDDQIGFDSVLELYYQFDQQSWTYLCLAPLSEFAYFSSQIDNALWLYDGFSNQEKYQFLSGQIPISTSEELVTSGNKDWSQILSCGPLSLAPQESIRVAFAIVGGINLEELKANIASAKIKYECLCTGIDEGNDDTNLPQEFSLGQNFPNPFNPATTIVFELKPENKGSILSFPSKKNGSFFIPQIEQISNINVNLRIYNIRGQLVKTLIKDQLPPGRYEIIWDGTDGNGKRVASGLYLYRLETPQSQTTRKMLLLK